MLEFSIFAIFVVIVLLASRNTLSSTKRSRPASTHRSASSTTHSSKPKKSGKVHSPTRRLRPIDAKPLWEGVKPSYPGVRLHRDRRESNPTDVTARLDRHKPGRVYLVRKGNVYKIGITSVFARTDRVATHEREGWLVDGIWDTPTLVAAREVEQAVLRHWRSHMGLRPVSIVMPQGGQSETAALSSPQLTATKRFLQEQLAAIASEKWPLRSISSLIVGERAMVSGMIAGKGQPFLSASIWKIELTDGSRRQLTIEFGAGAAGDVALSDLGTKIDVRGTVLGGQGRIMMSNPHYRLRTTGLHDIWVGPYDVARTGSAQDVVGEFIAVLPKQGLLLMVDGRTVTVFTKKAPPMVGPGIHYRVRGRYLSMTNFDAETIKIEHVGPREVRERGFDTARRDDGADQAPR